MGIFSPLVSRQNCSWNMTSGADLHGVVNFRYPCGQIESKGGTSSTGTKRPEAYVCKHINITFPLCSHPHLLLQVTAVRGGFLSSPSYMHPEADL